MWTVYCSKDHRIFFGLLYLVGREYSVRSNRLRPLIAWKAAFLHYHFDTFREVPASSSEGTFIAKVKVNTSATLNEDCKAGETATLAVLLLVQIQLC